MQVESGEELGDQGGERRQGEVGIVGHRRGVCAERQLRDDAAVAIAQAFHEGVPQGATHQHPVQHHHRPVTAGIGEVSIRRKQFPERRFVDDFDSAAVGRKLGRFAGFARESVLADDGEVRLTDDQVVGEPGDAAGHRGSG